MKGSEVKVLDIKESFVNFIMLFKVGFELEVYLLCLSDVIK